MVPCGSSPVARLYLAKNEAPEEESVAFSALLTFPALLIYVLVMFLDGEMTTESSIKPNVKPQLDFRAS